jgi:hypothetical protein
MTKPFKNLIDYLAAMKKRPGMYLGRPKISNFQHFMHGYTIAIGINGVNETHPLATEFYRFHDFASEKINTEHGHWHQILLDLCDGDEEKALYLCFEWLDEFILVLEKESGLS